MGALQTEASPGQSPEGGDAVKLSQDRFLELIEGELWRRFEKRLWGVVSIFLAAVTIAGLFGIPYYIGNETRKIFSEQTRVIEEEQRRFTSLVKAYFQVHSEYLEYRERLWRDLSTASALAAGYEETHPEIGPFNSLSDVLRRVVDESEPGRLLNSEMFSGSLERLRQEPYQDLDLPQQRIHLENSALGSASSSSSSHPYRNGRIEGLREDLKLRLLILSAYEDALHAMREEIAQVGGSNPLSRQTRRLEVDTAVNTVFTPLFDRHLEANARQVSFQAAADVNATNASNSDLYRYLSHYAQEAGIEPARLDSLERIVVAAARRQAERAPAPAPAPGRGNRSQP